jgi:hypothetical protein
MTMEYRPENFEANYAEMRERRRRKDIEAHNRRMQLIADNEAARVARGEPRQPPYVPQPDDEAYRARARVLMAQYEKDDEAYRARVRVLMDQLSGTASSTLAQ